MHKCAISGKIISKKIRYTRAYRIGNIKDRKAVDALVKALLDEYWSVRCSAAIALGYIGDIRVEGPLRLLLSDDNDAVRRDASDALKLLHEYSE